MAYQLGRFHEGLVGMKEMVAIVGVDPQPTEFLEFSEVVGASLSGRPIEAGFPQTKWTWGELEQWQFDALTLYCTGAASDVLIRTRVNSGTNYNYGVFRAVMTRPRAPTAPGYRRTNVEVVFVRLQSP